MNPPHRIGRGVPDVAAITDPETGVDIMHIDGKHPDSISGTSASAPLWAALNATLNQGLGSRCGLLWTMGVGSGACTFENITLVGTTGNSSFGTSMNKPVGVLGAGGERVTFRSITINGVSGHGFQIGSDPLNFYNNAPGLVILENVLVESATGVAFLLANFVNILASGLSALNCGSGLSSPQTGRVLDGETNGGIALTGLRIVDTQNPATSYGVYENGNTRGKTEGVIPLISNGSYSGSYNISGVTVTP